MWKILEKRIKNDKAPAELYQESDLVIRTMRDVFNARISSIICDSETVVRKIRDFLSMAMPRLRQKVAYYDGQIPLFHKYQIESEIARTGGSFLEKFSQPAFSGGASWAESHCNRK